MIESFLFERQQRVVLNGQKSERLTIKAGVPQASILGLLFFFYIYINDLSDNLKCNVKLFAGDTSMFSLVRDPINTSQKLSNDLVKLVFGPINEKYPSIQIHLNKIKTLFFHE